MVAIPRDYDEVLAFLYREPFANAPLLAAIERRVRVADTWIYRAEEIEGVLLLTPAGVGARSIGLEATTPAAAEALLSVLPAGEEFSFGLHREWLARFLEDRLRARRERHMAAFRCDVASFRPVPGGRRLEAGDTRAVRRCRDRPFHDSFLLSITGRRTPDDLAVAAFATFHAGRIAARCLATWGDRGIDRSLGTVWSVFTEPKYRGQGFGSAVVSVATGTILATGRAARYFADWDNAASRRLCAALGYSHDHDVHAYIGLRRRGERRDDRPWM
jgi:GNAT superfamily N-acetyltransferase